MHTAEPGASWQHVAYSSGFAKMQVMMSLWRWRALVAPDVDRSRRDVNCWYIIVMVCCLWSMTMKAVGGDINDSRIRKKYEGKANTKNMVWYQLAHGIVPYTIVFVFVVSGQDDRSVRPLSGRRNCEDKAFLMSQCLLTSHCALSYVTINKRLM